MRHKINALIVRSDFNIQRNDLLSARNEIAYRELNSRIHNIEQEMSALVNFSRSLYPKGEVNKEKILAIQRRQGGLKRKLANMKMETSQIGIECKKCEQERVTLSEKRKMLLKKMDKYKYLHMVERREKRLKDARIEESEIEERVSWSR